MNMMPIYGNVRRANIGWHLFLDRFMQSFKFYMSWRSFLILFYNRCPPNYMYLNLQPPFSCSLAIMSIYGHGNEIKINTAKKECIWLASGQACNERERVWLAHMFERSCLLLVHTPSSESCYCHVIFTKYYYNSFIDISPLLWLMFTTLFKNIQWNLRTFKST